MFAAAWLLSPIQLSQYALHCCLSEIYKAISHLPACPTSVSCSEPFRDSPWPTARAANLSAGQNTKLWWESLLPLSVSRAFVSALCDPPPYLQPPQTFPHCPNMTSLEKCPRLCFLLPSILGSLSFLGSSSSGFVLCHLPTEPGLVPALPVQEQSSVGERRLSSSREGSGGCRMLCWR